MKAPLIAIARHRLSIDGQGVTTLVAFHGCRLDCKYCLNRQCLEVDGVWRTISETELLEATRADDLYFKATGGGICFGGGEPLLRSDFIAAFCKICPKEWNIYIETSLNAERQQIETVMPFVSHFFVDIKDMNPTIYKAYTGRSNRLVTEHLRWLCEQQLQDRVTIRLPLIAHYNTEADRALSRQQLEALGFKDFDLFDYVVRD